MDRRQLEPIAREHGVELLVQFGSSVRGTSHPQSDIDVGALFVRVPESLGDLAELSAALQPLFPDRAVDLAILNHADPLFLKQVAEGGVLLYGATARWRDFQLYAFKRYQDHRRFLQMERDYVNRAIASAPR